MVELTSTLSIEEVCEAVAECVVFTKIQNTNDDYLPVYVSNILPSASFDSNAFRFLKEEIAHNADLANMRAVDDLIAVLDSIEPTVTFLHLDLFDVFQITRGGVVLLSVQMESNHNGRMACIDIYNLRQQIHQQALGKKNDTFCNRRDVSLSTLVLIAVGLMVWAITIATSISY